MVQLRTAAIWMDEFGAVVKETLFADNVNIGPLDQMLALKKRLGCKPFSWSVQLPDSVQTLQLTPSLDWNCKFSVVFFSRSPCATE